MNWPYTTACIVGVIIIAACIKPAKPQGFRFMQTLKAWFKRWFN